MSKITNDRLNPVWHRMLYSCTLMALTVGVKGLMVCVPRSASRGDCRSEQRDHGGPNDDRQTVGHVCRVTAQPGVSECCWQDAARRREFHRSTWPAGPAAAPAGPSSAVERPATPAGEPDGKNSPWMTLRLLELQWLLRWKRVVM